MSTPLIEIKNLSAGYDGRTVLHDVNLTVYDRDFLGIIGPNGGGKTTLIKCILGLLKHFCILVGGKIYIKIIDRILRLILEKHLIVKMRNRRFAGAAGLAYDIAALHDRTGLDGDLAQMCVACAVIEAMRHFDTIAISTFT